jgi:hypothetical protein
LEILEGSEGAIIEPMRLSRLLDYGDRVPSFSAHPLNVTLCSTLAQGGIAHYSHGLAGALQAMGIDTTVLMYSTPDFDLEAFPRHHQIVKTLELSISRRTAVTSPFRNLYEMLKTTRRIGYTGRCCAVWASASCTPLTMCCRTSRRS